MGIIFGSCARLHSPEAELLLEAAKAGDFKRVDEILNRHPDLLTAKKGLSDDSTLLHHAAKTGRLTFLSLILEFAQGPHSLFAALTPEARRAKVLSLLNRTNSKGYTPLMVACKKGHADCAAFLVEQVSRLLCHRSGNLLVPE